MADYGGCSFSLPLLHTEGRVGGGGGRIRALPKAEFDLLTWNGVIDSRGEESAGDSMVRLRRLEPRFACGLEKACVSQDR